MAKAATKTPTPLEVATRYFDATARRDVEGMLACWRPGGLERLVGQHELAVPDEMREYFTALFAAFPDFRLDVVQTVADEQRCVARWSATGTFAGGPFQDLEPTGARVAIEGCDVLAVEDGLIVRNDAYLDGADLARQIGVLPPLGSAQEQRLTGLANRRTKVSSWIAGGDLEPVAEGVWLVRGGIPRTMNVYLIEDDGGVTVFDAGIEAMTKAVARAGARLGGIRRRDVVFPAGCGGPRARGVSESEVLGEAYLGEERQRFLELLFRLAREADDQVGRNGQARDRGP